MRGPSSLRVAFTWWFAGTLVLLYGVAATAVWLHARVSDRQYAVLTLKEEVEVVAGYLATTGRFDAPELTAPESTPFPIWLRLVRGDEVLAQTPGAPDVPVGFRGPTKGKSMTEWSASVTPAYLVVYHVVGGSMPGAALEGIAPLASLVSAQRRLAIALALGGLVVIPIAALGGRLLAQRTLRPIDGLVARIRSLDSARLADRLVIPDGAVEEVDVLARAFNDLLARLEASVDTMRRFTADASHEIRNPLSVLRTGLEVVLRRPRPAEEYRRLIEENLDELTRLGAVVEGLLALASDAPGSDYVLTKSPVDLSDVVARTAKSFATVAAERTVGIEQDVEPGLVVDGDAQILRLAVFNLLDNALKHSPPGESVRVRAHASDGEIVLRVADLGAGVAPEDRERLFRRFFRADRAPRAGVGGLGLSVVRWATELHGGRVGLVDVARGTTFEITLPRAPRVVAAAGVEPAARYIEPDESVLRNRGSR